MITHVCAAQKIDHRATRDVSHEALLYEWSKDPKNPQYVTIPLAAPSGGAIMFRICKNCGCLYAVMA